MHMQGLGQVNRQGISPGHLKVLQAAERTAQRMIEFTGGNRAKIASELRKEDPRLPAKWRKLTGVLRRRGVDKAAERALLLVLADASIDRAIEMGAEMQRPDVPSLSGVKSALKGVVGWVGETVNNLACDEEAVDAASSLAFQGNVSGEDGSYQAGVEAKNKTTLGLTGACAATGGKDTGGEAVRVPGTAPQQQPAPNITVEGGGMPEWLPIALIGMGGFMVVALLIVAVKD